jgi:hypothetical protein
MSHSGKNYIQPIWNLNAPGNAGRVLIYVPVFAARVAPNAMISRSSV